MFITLFSILTYIFKVFTSKINKPFIISTQDVYVINTAKYIRFIKENKTLLKDSKISI